MIVVVVVARHLHVLRIRASTTNTRQHAHTTICKAQPRGGGSANYWPASCYVSLEHSSLHKSAALFIKKVQGASLKYVFASHTRLYEPASQPSEPKDHLYGLCRVYLLPWNICVPDICRRLWHGMAPLAKDLWIPFRSNSPKKRVPPSIKAVFIIYFFSIQIVSLSAYLAGALVSVFG